MRWKQAPLKLFCTNNIKQRAEEADSISYGYDMCHCKVPHIRNTLKIEVTRKVETAELSLKQPAIQRTELNSF